MNKYIKPYLELVNENFQQFGVVLIKGKPTGKGGPVKLFAAHVMSTVEIRPGATMLLLSNIFYRIIQEDGRLRAIKISYGEDDNLKAALNFKTSGRPSVVKNNNKTPFHWRTLKYSDINQALSTVDRDLLGPDYIFESLNSSNSGLKQLLDASLRGIFLGENQEFIILNITVPPDLITDAASDSEGGTAVIDDWEMTFEVLNISSNDFGVSRRFSLEFTLDTKADYEVESESGGYQEPAYSEVKVTHCETIITSVILNDGHDDIELEDADLSKKVNHQIAEYEPDDFEYNLNKAGLLLNL
jgi:hypothetical protein